MRMSERMKGIATGVITPIRFATNTGHFRSSVERRAVDRNGDALPWFTYPAIYFLQQLDWSDDVVVEFGGGQSSAWWAAHAKRVFTYENDEQWACRVREMVNGQPHVTVEAKPTGRAMAEAARNLTEPVTVVIVDNARSGVVDKQADGGRLVTAQAAAEIVSGDPVIILDNADGHWSLDDSPTYPILDLMDAAGWLRIDFAGYAPGTLTPHCTSVFVRPDTKRLRGLPPPPRLPK